MPLWPHTKILFTIGSDNGLWSFQSQAITWTDASILSVKFEKKISLRNSLFFLVCEMDTNHISCSWQLKSEQNASKSLINSYATGRYGFNLK